MSNNILEIKNLAKRYGDTRAVNGVSFSIGQGEILGLLGPNGAGKTTTIDMVLGLLTPDGGEIKVFGKNFAKHRAEILGRVGFAAVYSLLPGNLTVRQNLFIFSLLYDIPSPRARVEEIIKEFELERFRAMRTGLLSSGEQSRVQLAKALLAKPKLLLLDEPTASIDPASSHSLRERIRMYAKNDAAGILWTSHDMHEIEQVCDRVLFISHGKILLEGNPRTLPQEHKKNNLEELFIAVAHEPLSFGQGQ